ncbi:MAG: hypothetical protein AB7Q17_14340 [Phycisphaerae bacterium]
MTIERLREAARATPFKPFSISLADGRTVLVPHPECIRVPPEAQRTFVVVQGEESYSIIDLLLVTSLDFSNGRTARRRRR